MQNLQRKRNPFLSWLTPLAILVLLFLLPPERILGDVIKLVLLHGVGAGGAGLGLQLLVCWRSALSVRTRCGNAGVWQFKWLRSCFGWAMWFPAASPN